MLPKKLLLVDDDRDVRESMRMLLEMEGYEVLEASNGREALEAANSQNPDLIVLDMWMPIMSGMEFCRIRSVDPKLQQIPVIACSADRDIVRDPSLKTQAFIQKPVDLDDLLDKTSQLLVA